MKFKPLILCFLLSSCQPKYNDDPWVLQTQWKSFVGEEHVFEGFVHLRHIVILEPCATNCDKAYHPVYYELNLTEEQIEHIQRIEIDHPRCWLKIKARLLKEVNTLQVIEILRCGSMID